MNWEVVIGLETHAQLQTKSKIFSGASTAFGAEPNRQACAVDIALPGVLPVLNREAVVCAIKFGLAVGGDIAPRSIFARKNYFYPDLPKGYQISQYEIPVVSGGSVAITVSHGDAPVDKTVRLTRAHLEEDAGKSLHELSGSHVALGHGKTGIDLNRAGTPLLEIVTEPDMRSSAEAVAYAKALHSLVTWIGICDGNMQEGSFRCDANVSVRRPGGPLGTRREIKNLNSFRFLQQAIDYEIQWQINEIEEGRQIQQATVLFDPDTGETRAMRSKEDAHDYRYFPDPDLLPLEITPMWIEEVKSEMLESPAARTARFESEFGLSKYDALVLNNGFDIGNYFEGVVRSAVRSGERVTPELAKICANWVINEVSAQMNQEGEAHPTWQFGVSADTLGHLLRRMREGVIGAKVVKKLFSDFWEEARQCAYEHQGGYPEKVDEEIESRGLKQVSDASAIEPIIDAVLAANQKSVEEFRAGKEKAFNALVGQAMKATKGKANPQQVNDLLRKKLGG